MTGAALTTAVGITNSGGEGLLSGGNLQLKDSIVLSLGSSDDVTASHDDDGVALAIEKYLLTDVEISA